jgi:hypothetical protein
LIYFTINVEEEREEEKEKQINITKIQYTNTELYTWQLVAVTW